MIRDIKIALNNYPNLPSEYTGYSTIQKWVSFFETKEATYDLTESELRQLKFDLEHAMTQFNEVVLAQR